MKSIDIADYRDCFIDDNAYLLFIRAMSTALSKQDVVPVKWGNQIIFLMISSQKLQDIVLDSFRSE